MMAQDRFYNKLYRFVRQKNWSEVNSLLKKQSYLCFSTDRLEGEYFGFSLIDHAAIQGNIDQILILRNKYKLNIFPSYTVLFRLLTVIENGCGVFESLRANKLISTDIVIKADDEKFITIFEYLNRNRFLTNLDKITEKLKPRYTTIFKNDLLDCARDNIWDKVFYFLNNGVDPAAQKDHWTLLHYACWHQNLDVMRVLRDYFHLDAMTLFLSDHPNKLEFIAYYMRDISVSEELFFETADVSKIVNVMIEEVLEEPIECKGIKELSPEYDEEYRPTEHARKYYEPIMRPRLL